MAEETAGKAMQCRPDLLLPWPSELSSLYPALEFGNECDVLVWGTRERCPVLDELTDAVLAGDKVERDALSALAAVVHFTTIPPRHRIPPAFAYTRLGASDVKKECGLDEPFWKFGVQKRTRVRIFAADVSDRRPPAIVLLAVTVKHGREDDWKSVKRAWSALREGGAR